MHCRRIIVLATLLAACSKPVSPPAVAPRAAAPAPAPASAPPAPSAATASDPLRGGESADSFFDPSKYPNAVEGRFVDPATLSATERKWGQSPHPDPRVKYQDDVLLMEHGDQALRGGGTDGITYQFDARAEHVGDFQEGKILFATGRVVGRIAQLTRQGDSVTVKLTPVQITDVIKEGQFIINGTVDVDQMIARTAPDMPAYVDNSEAPPQGLNLALDEPRMIPAMFDAAPPGATPPGPAASTPALSGTAHPNPAAATAVLPSGLGQKLMPPPLPIPPATPASTLNLDGDDFEAGFLEEATTNGVGVSYKYDKKGIYVGAAGVLLVGKPVIKCLLIFSSKGVDTFGIDMTGTLGLRLAIKASADAERFINAKIIAAPPFDISLPVPIAGVPLELSFGASFALNTGFTAKRSVLQARGEYQLDGHLFTGWKNGSPSFDYPTVKPTVRLVENVQGVSMGINTLGGTFRVSPQIGIGAFGFKTGVYMGVTFSGNGVKQSNTARECRGADLTGRVDSGIGYQLNSFLVDLVNKVLSTFSKFRLPKSGTLVHGPSGQIIKIDEDIPNDCAGLGKTASNAGTDSVPASPSWSLEASPPKSPIA